MVVASLATCLAATSGHYCGIYWFYDVSSFGQGLPRVTLIEIRTPHNPAEVRQIEELQRVTWGSELVTPYNTLLAWMHAGGIVLGAFDGAQMIGFVASFLGEVGGKRLQWSHIAAVLPAYRRQGIARQLKFEQRSQALAQGLDTIGWTFDPLRRENALLNIETLGATCHILHPEIYGQMPGNLSGGLLSDRLEVTWELNDGMVIARANGQHIEATPKPESIWLNLENLEPSIEVVPLHGQRVGLEVPSDLQLLRQTSTELTHRWYFAMREAVASLFEANYAIQGIYLDPNRPDVFTYVLERDVSWFLYILETADGSLYTGITTDIEKRIDTHNKGRGAKYTATRGPVKLLAAWETFGRGRALQLELRLKKLTRARKLNLITSGLPFEDAPRKI
jgi:predicted GNAT superfamily acetyltransferase